MLPQPAVDVVAAPEEDRHERQWLASVVVGLPERQRLIVFLRYYADLDYRAIATVLGIEVGTIGPALGAAHRSLRKALQEVETHG